MSKSRIEAALRAAPDTDEYLAERGALAAVPEVFRRVFGGRRAMIVADGNTWRAAGERVKAALSSAGVDLVEPVLFPGDPVLPAEYRHVMTIRRRIEETGAIPVAVGAGTINDLAKLAAHEAGVRYMCVATAASVDGFTSFGAAILKDSFKQTLDCAASAAVVADIDVLRAAPPDMTASGYGDLASKLTAGADWIIADRLGLEPIHPVAWDIVQTDLRRWLGRPRGLRALQPGPFEALFEGLSMNGFAMQAMRGSRSASGAEHLFSHIWEMEHLEVGGKTVSHGFKVAIGTLATTALMERLFARDIERLDIERRVAQWPSWSEREDEVRKAFGGTPIFEEVLKTCRDKYLEPAALAERLALARRSWDALRKAVKRQLLSYGRLEQMFGEAGAPTRPEQIGLTRERVRETFVRAQMIRTRYTVLDLAYETGWLEECVEEIFASKGYLP